MLRLLRSGYGHFSARRSIGPARWPHHDLFFVHRGAVVLEFPELEQRIHLSRGTGVLIWPQTSFRGQPVGNDARASIQHFAFSTKTTAPFDRLARSKEGFSRQGAPASVWLENCVDRLQHATTRPFDEEIAPLRALLLQVVLLEGGFLDYAARPVAEPRIPVAQLERWLQANLAANPTLPALAQFCGLSSSRFRSVFREQTGQTAGQFLRQIRDVEAKRRLVETPEPIKAIAAALGYASPAVFHHAFKLRTGQTPARFRRRESISG